MSRGSLGGAFFLLTILAVMAQETTPEIALPTANHALLEGQPQNFYQVIERNLHGVISHPWEGGQYGFVRDPVEVGGLTIYTRFHEGIDIRPVARDSHGEPQDAVNSIADGKVVYANAVAGTSNYGRYVVVEHLWDGAPYYSLYAHLNTIAATPGEFVRRGEKLGIMGHTGAGIDRERAHLHVELNLLFNDHFEQWHDIFFAGETNHHGIYNGLNLAGLDLAKFYLARQKNPALSVPEFLRREEIFDEVIVPNTPNFQLSRRYPGLIQRSPNESPNEKPNSWEIAFSRSGLPLRLRPSARKVGAPELTYVKATSIDARYLSRGDLTGHGESARLTKTGEGYLRLLTFPD